jgi:hypothetical protein
MKNMAVELPKWTYCLLFFFLITGGLKRFDLPDLPLAVERPVLNDCI